VSERIPEHINMRHWPFNVVPDEETAAVWVGRPEARKQLDRLLRATSRIPASQLALLWAAFGSGKTHALRYLHRKALEAGGVSPLYVVTPKGIRSFLDLYRAIVDAAIEDGLAQAVGRLLYADAAAGPLSDMERALLNLADGASAPAQVATAWLRAERVRLNDIRAIGIGSRIETPADAVEALHGFLSSVKKRRPVMLLVDEVQELDDLGRKQHAESVGGLHKVFDRNARGLTLVLSFTTATQDAVKGILGDALFDRSGQMLSLPALDRSEAVAFVADLLRAWSIEPDRAPYPFAEEAIDAVVAKLDTALPELYPRALIKAFNNVLIDAEFDIENGEISEIDAGYALARATVELD
jgi:AAA ATPase domain